MLHVELEIFHFQTGFFCFKDSRNAVLKHNSGLRLCSEPLDAGVYVSLAIPNAIVTGVVFYSYVDRALLFLVAARLCLPLNISPSVSVINCSVFLKKKSEPI